MSEKLKITKKNPLKGDDGYKTFSVRVKDDTINEIEKISAKTNRSRNELINMMLEYGITHYIIEE
ncbi:MAG: ribbon-helix-helix domain-containing protein [Ruminococcus sp.]|jgi:metal-responsive CopG/Arc/MetJ family transcriptional regulator|nr:ribbon-helix-helix domain-containing protein [Ruminococcus sp.]